MKQSASLTVGPFFRIGLIYGKPQNDLVDDQTAGECITLTGVVYDGEGKPIPDAMIEIWQPDANGIFNHPLDPLHERADPHFRGFGRAETRNAGKYEFKTVKPGGRDGGSPHVNMHIFGRGMLVQALTRMYFSDEPANAEDPALRSVDPARRHTLIAKREQAEGPPVYRFDIHMQGKDETVFFNP